ncbi:hypothetical protein ACIRQQ_45795 [Streptomyces fuscichromogenes]|uniref:hypothetical protein n=1 Tax=Streptomyces fuscichromogenes TaxID=1324013 RepID=UPI00381C01AC
MPGAAGTITYPSRQGRAQAGEVLTGCYSVGDDTLWGINHHRTGAVNTRRREHARNRGEKGIRRGGRPLAAAA